MIFSVQISLLSHTCISAVIQIKSQIRSVHCFVIYRVSPPPFLFPGKLFVEVFPQFEFASYIPVVAVNMFLCALGFLLIGIRFRGLIRFSLYEVLSLSLSHPFFPFEG